MVKGPIDPVAARVLARQRHEVIVAEVRRRGAVRVSELATLLTVSDMTVRRDLDLLDEAGLARRPCHKPAPGWWERSATG